MSEAILQAYEGKVGDVFSADEEKAVIQGSWDEDDDWRFMRHFYDPVNQTGLFGQYEASKYWAQNTEAQANYECVGAWFCYGDDVDYRDKYFSSPTDFSWDRAIYEYAWGDKIRAAAALGHIIHLLEDATVPAHVRNDAHPSAFGIELEADLYEKYTSAYSAGKVSVPSGLSTPIFSGLSHAFDDVSRFTNQNFLSIDSGIDIYPAPSTELLQRSGEFLFNAKLQARIARIEEEVVRKNGRLETVYAYKVSDRANLIQQDYWRVLSKKAIEAGVGVIDLFFREVEKERRTGALKAKNISAAEKRAKDNAKKYFGVVKALYGSSLDQSDVEELLGDGRAQAGAAALAVTPKPQEDISEPRATPVERAPTPAPETVEEPERPSEEIKLSVAQEQKNPTQEPLQQQSLVPVTPGFGGGGGSGGSEAEEASAADTEPVPLTIASPIGGTFFATTTITFSGATAANGLISLESGTSTATTTADASGNWSVPILLNEGNPTVTVHASDSSGERATSTSVSTFVDITPPSLTTVSLPQCGDSLSLSFCLVATTSIAVEWSLVPDASYYAVILNGINGATTTATSSIEAVSNSASSSIAVVAYDEAGNSATSTSLELFAFERPVIISEIAWAGTDASATDEWIELGNRSSFTIDLSKIVLVKDSSSTSLSGTIEPGAFYLIEDRAEATSKTHSVIVDLDLTDVGAKISLLDSEGNIIDGTPEVSTCNGWCAGSAAATVGTSTQYGNLTAKTSMERVSADSDGSLAASWQSNDTYIRISSSKATDNGGGTVLGTPGMENSAGLPTAGWNCGSGTLSSSGGAYNPTSSSCTYLSAFVSTQANRYGDVFKGTVGSSTLVSGHSLAKSIRSDQNDGGILSGAIAGDQFFVAMYEVRNGPAFSSDLTDFRNYMRTGVGSPPHSNYVTIPWTYSP